MGVKMTMVLLTFRKFHSIITLDAREIPRMPLCDVKYVWPLEYKSFFKRWGCVQYYIQFLGNCIQQVKRNDHSNQ